MTDARKEKARKAAERIKLATEDFVESETPEVQVPHKVTRSKRGFTQETKFTQLCYKTTEARKKQVRQYCLDHDKEIGEFMSDVVNAFLDKEYGEL